MINVKLSFESQAEAIDYLQGLQVRFAVSDWLEEVRATLKHDATVSQEEYILLEKWRNKLIDHINSYTEFEI